MRVLLWRCDVFPVTAALGGMVVPALIYVAFNVGVGDGSLRGWAIPIATDIAFALAVLAIISTHLTVALRPFSSLSQWSTTCLRSRSSPCFTPVRCRRSRLSWRLSL